MVFLKAQNYNLSDLNGTEQSLSAIAKTHNVPIHLYSDNALLHLLFSTDESKGATKQFALKISNSEWQGTYSSSRIPKLKLIMFGSPRDLKKVKE